MQNDLIKTLSEITPAEKAMLDGKGFDKSVYNVAADYVIRSARLLGDKNMVATRHPRFCEFPLHGHDYMEVMYVCSGNITHVIEGKRVNVAQGGLLLLNKHVRHSIMRADSDDIGINFVLSDNLLTAVVNSHANADLLTEFVANNLRKDGSAQYLLYDIGNVYPVRNLLDNLIYTVASPHCIDTPLLPKLVALLLDYLSLHVEDAIDGSAEPDPTAKFRRAVNDYIDGNYPTATLDELSGKTGLNAQYLSRKISDVYGKSFKQLLTEQRLLAAEKLFADTSLNVDEVANAVGYENVSHFYRVFEGKHGVTPAHWRKKNKR